LRNGQTAETGKKEKKKTQKKKKKKLHRLRRGGQTHPAAAAHENEANGTGGARWEKRIVKDDLLWTIPRSTIHGTGAAPLSDAARASKKPSVVGGRMPKWGGGKGGEGSRTTGEPVKSKFPQARGRQLVYR